jgi:hypothetical protein
MRGIAVENTAHHHDGTSRFDFFAKDFGAVRRGENRLGRVNAHFPPIDVESGDDFDILWLIRPNLSVHQPDIGTVAGRTSIEVDALKK